MVLLPQFLPEPGIPAVQIRVGPDVVLEVLVQAGEGGEAAEGDQDQPPRPVLERLLVGRPELQLGPHGVNVGGAEHDDGAPAGLHAVQDLVRDHLPHAPVPRVDQALEPE